MLEIFILTLLVSQRPVIELDELEIEGELRRPKVIDLQGSRLSERLEESALFNLIQLEKKLLKPLSLEELENQKPSK